MGGTYRACRGEERSIQDFGGETREKRPLGRPRRRYEDNIQMDFQKWDVGACTGLSWLRTGTGGGNFECSNEYWGSIK